MDKISAKQVEGIVDTATRQQIDGEKIFSSPTNFLSPFGKEFTAMCIDGLNIYWLITPGVFDQEGNRRLGIDPESGVFGLQEFKGGMWNSINL
jgi:hypothetical protein